MPRILETTLPAYLAEWNRTIGELVDGCVEESILLGDAHHVSSVQQTSGYMYSGLLF